MTNPKIINYFNEHTDIEPETAFLFFIELLEKFGNNISEKINASTNTQILSNILELKQKNQMIYDNLNRINTDITNSLFIKMIEIKKEYIEDIKSIISLNTNEKILSILEKNNSLLIDKVTILLNDVVPKTNQTLYNHIDENIRMFQKTITDDTTVILKTLNNNVDIKEYFNIFEQKFSNMLQNILSPQDKLYSDLNDFLSKYRLNSTYKGQYSENHLFILLNQMFPSGEVINTTSQKASGDFMLKRENKPNIIFENKDYESNVYIEEIRKFIRDIETQNSHGIFLSQKSGIASRTNYQIEFHKGNILVFVHNVEYSKDKIQIAIDIIDNLSLKLKECSFDENDSNNISKELLEDINKEYQNFANQKDILIGIIKESNKKFLSQLEEFKFPSLDKYLSNKFASTVNVTRLNNQYKCEICNNFTANTLKSLSAHKRAHNINKQINSETASNIVNQIIKQNKFYKNEIKLSTDAVDTPSTTDSSEKNDIIKNTINPFRYCDII